MEKQSIETALEAYFNGTLSADEAARVEAWIKKSDANRLEARGISTVNFLLDSCQHPGKDNTISALAKVRSSIRANRLRAFALRLQRIAALVALPLMFTGVYMYHLLGEQKNTFIEVRSNTGMVSEVVLPDNTTVWLNSNSSLRYPERFSGKQRRVELTGEGFFDVSHDAARKFIVEAGPSEIEVYGTQFNIEAYGHEGNIHTTLVEGSVGFRYENAGGEKVLVRLVPGQNITYYTGGRYAQLRSVDTAVSTSWKEGKIMLRNTPLDQALRIIGNRYNVSFEIRNSKLLDNTYVGTFSNQTLETVLRYFSLSSDITFSPVPRPPGEMYSGREIIEVY